MGWATLRYSLGEVDRAGKALVSSASAEDRDQALAVVNNWRAAHSFPLNTFKLTLRRKAGGRSVTAQRLKRISSIETKLRLIPTLRLSEMQDIGGCRAIMPSVSEVRGVVDRYLKSEIKHKLIDQDDYITQPKGSGYRGIHLIYRYFSDRKQTYNRRKIEMQFRTEAQHIWATAVETIGTFTSQALKSSLGEEDWLRFFALMGTDMALREGTPPVPNTPTNGAELSAEIRQLVDSLGVIPRLDSYRAVVSHIGESRLADKYFLLTLDSSAQLVTITGYRQAELPLASKRYLEVEQAGEGRRDRDAVLVSVESVATLERAYPNYFLDTHRFLDAVQIAIASVARPRSASVRRPAKSK